jgi:hypothetical protein
MATSRLLPHYRLLGMTFYGCLVTTHSIMSISRQLSIFLIVVLAGCNNLKHSSVDESKESLETVLKANHILLKSMTEVNSTLDSIDYYRKSSALITSDDQPIGLTDRMKALTQYVKETEAKISRIERDLKITRKETDAYLLMVLALKDEVALRDEELRHLSDSVARSKSILTTVSITPEITEPTLILH